MNKYLPRKLTDIKGRTALAELQRTHLIVVLLAALVIMLLVVVSHSVAGIPNELTLSAITLLAIVGLISLATAIGLSKLLKK